MKASLRAKRLARRHRLKSQSAKLNLTSLMDIFTILVFFLMINSGDVEVLQSPKNITLPESVSTQKPDLTLLIMISETDVMIQGRSIASVEEILSQEQEAIAALDRELQLLASSKPILTDLEKEKGRAVTIMGDKNAPYRILKRVIATCAQTGYRNISLAVAALPATDKKSLIKVSSPATLLGSS